MRPPIFLACLAALAACQPPATDDYVERIALEEGTNFASEPLPSPDSEGAVWARSDTEDRLLYGIPGDMPFLAMQCTSDGEEPMLAFTRFSPADRGATAIMALVGNFHVARLPVDATFNGRAWLWQGSVAAREPDMDVLTGPRSVEATIPGAGSLILNPSPLSRDLVNNCRAIGRPQDPEAEETETEQVGTGEPETGEPEIAGPE
ncbi:hypothetical protein [Parerythrobacter jejuensis]|uniref:Lipoprotein n=1 Tax=Parerythrobacter jejuensis TaxID=795812 RepID=A0A845ARJ9_9SPHN|nr:hypothetical protein [Parerythrobacter jejuensis]MXP32940.1 hypothetical protein [Parerythrobacter jejuensis]